jgi:homoserine dehydrogenase
MSQIASLLGEQGISIEALIQKAPASGQDRVPVIVVTNVATQGDLETAAHAIEALPTINGRITRIRVETLDG